MKKTFQPKTVDKYLDFLHYLRLQLQQNDPKFKITHAYNTWSINSNIMKILLDLNLVTRIERGKYQWVGPRPDEQTAVAVLEALFVDSSPRALLPGPANSTPLGAELSNLKTRVEELETIVLRLMEDAA